MDGSPRMTRTDGRAGRLYVGQKHVKRQRVVCRPPTDRRPSTATLYGRTDGDGDWTARVGPLGVAATTDCTVGVREL